MAFEFNYTAPPTVSQFIKSTAKRAFILGPVGCLPAEAEFLSPIGWKRMDTFLPGDLVAQWDESGRITFISPEYVKLPQEEPFHRFTTAHSIDMPVSNEHRICYYNWRKELSITTADKIAVQFKKNRTEGPRYDIPVTFRLPEKQEGLWLTDAELRVMVAVHADGHFVQYYRERNIPKCVIGIRKERKKTRLRSILVDAHISWTERVYAGRPTESIFTFIAPTISKHYTSSWYKVTQTQAEIIYNEFPYWDGLIHADGEIRFSTTSETDASYIQFICSAVGHRATISKFNDPRGDGKWGPHYTVYAVRQLDQCVTFRNATYGQIESTDGFKYCFVVPSSFFLARYNGKIFVTGNSGKSVGCCIKIFRIALNQAPGIDGIRRTRFVIVRNTQDQLNKTTLKTWQEWFPDGPLGVYKIAAKTYMMNFIPPDGIPVCSEVMFVALDDAADVAKVLSMEVTAGWINECREIPREIVENLGKRCGRYPSARQKPEAVPAAEWPTYAGLFGDTNAPEEDSYWQHIFDHLPIDEDNPNSVLACDTFKQPAGDSPDAENIENLPFGYYEQSGESDEWYRTMVQVKYARSIKGKPVYEKTFKPERHISKVPLKLWANLPIIIGQDCARSPASVLMQMLPNGRINILREATGFDMGAKTFVSMKLRPVLRNDAIENPLVFIGDPSWVRQNDTDDNSWKKELTAIFKREEGHHVKSAETNDPIRRITALDEALRTYPDGDPLVMIDPSCTMLIQAMRNKYRYGRIKGSDNKYHDRPDKNNWSHVAEAAQYGILFLTGKYYRVDDYIRITHNAFTGNTSYRPADSRTGY